MLVAPGGGVTATPSSTVEVRLAGGKAVLSRRSVPAGVVRFVVTGTGGVAQEFSIGGKRTRPLKAGRRQTLVVRFGKPGTYRYVCRLRGRTVGTRGTIRVVEPPEREDEPGPGDALKLTAVGTFERPTDVDAPATESGSWSSSSVG